MAGPSLIGTPSVPGAGVTGALPVAQAANTAIDWGNLWNLAGQSPAVGGSAGGTGITTSPLSGVSNAVSNAASWITDVFLRSVIIILGFIFVAAGLYMLGGVSKIKGLIP